MKKEINVTYNEIGQLKVTKQQLNYKDLEVFQFPKNCMSCPVGFHSYKCGRNFPMKPEDSERRPPTCKLRLAESHFTTKRFYKICWSRRHNSKIHGEIILHATSRTAAIKAFRRRTIYWDCEIDCIVENMRTVPLEECPYGLFRYNNEIYMKTSKQSNSSYQCYSVDSGKMCIYSPDIEVLPVYLGETAVKHVD